MRRDDPACAHHSAQTEAASRRSNVHQWLLLTPAAIRNNTLVVRTANLSDSKVFRRGLRREFGTATCGWSDGSPRRCRCLYAPFTHRDATTFTGQWTVSTPMMRSGPAVARYCRRNRFFTIKASAHTGGARAEERPRPTRKSQDPREMVALVCSFRAVRDSTISSALDMLPDEVTISVSRQALLPAGNTAVVDRSVTLEEAEGATSRGARGNLILLRSKFNWAPSFARPSRTGCWSAALPPRTVGVVLKTTRTRRRFRGAGTGHVARDAPVSIGHRTPDGERRSENDVRSPLRCVMLAPAETVPEIHRGGPSGAPIPDGVDRCGRRPP